MKIMAVADTELPYLYEYYNPQRTKGVDVIIACGDLKAKYLEFLTTVVNKPLFYVRGNHDTDFKEKPPEGCTCIDGRMYEFNGLRLLGLGGSMRYNTSPFMYTETQMERRIRRLRMKMRIYEGFDVLVAHSPAAGYGDLEDLPHRGFECFNKLLETYKPAYMLHGHVHREYGDFQAVREHHSGTKIINCYGYQIIDIPDEIITERSKWAKRLIRMYQLKEYRKGEEFDASTYLDGSGSWFGGI